MTSRLSPQQRNEALAGLPGWHLAETQDAIHRSFVFRDFSEAFAFMTRVALAAEKADHHPDWSNSWNRVEVRLTTHATHDLTEKDLALARIIQMLSPA